MERFVPKLAMDFEFKKRSAQAREKVENLFEFEGCKVRFTKSVNKFAQTVIIRWEGAHMGMCTRQREKMGEGEKKSKIWIE